MRVGAGLAVEHSGSVAGRVVWPYPASGIELVEIQYDASKGMLTGTKLTGNQYVRAGRVSGGCAAAQSACPTRRFQATEEGMSLT